MHLWDSISAKLIWIAAKFYLIEMENSLNEDKFIKTLDNITIVGTLHISESSRNMVEKIIDEWHPDAIMLELDDLRMQAFEHPFSYPIGITVEKMDEQDDESDELDGFGLLKEMEHLQFEISKTMSESLGEEMKIAIRKGKEKGLPVIPIDKSIEELAAELQSKLTPKKKRELKKRIQEEVSSGVTKEQYQELMEKIQSPEGLMEIINDLKSEFPEIVDSLLSDRNQFMVNQILSYRKDHPKEKLLIVVGLGHLHEIFELLKQKL